jgi:hypothetical protein
MPAMAPAALAHPYRTQLAAHCRASLLFASPSSPLLTKQKHKQQNHSDHEEEPPTFPNALNSSSSSSSTTTTTATTSVRACVKKKQTLEHQTLERQSVLGEFTT